MRLKLESCTEEDVNPNKAPKKFPIHTTFGKYSNDWSMGEGYLFIGANLDKIKKYSNSVGFVLGHMSSPNYCMTENERTGLAFEFTELKIEDIVEMRDFLNHVVVEYNKIVESP